MTILENLILYLFERSGTFARLSRLQSKLLAIHNPVGNVKSMFKKSKGKFVCAFRQNDFKKGRTRDTFYAVCLFKTKQRLERGTIEKDFVKEPY